MSDLISREKLTKKLEYLCDCLCDYSKRQREFMCDACKLGAVIDAVEEMPSVETERKKGHWIMQNDRSKKLLGWSFCSECNAWIGEPTDYCSNCGADMREVDG